MSHGLKISGGDLVINQGALQTISNADKLQQMILKICLTPVGGNPIHPSYGSYLSRSIVGNPLQSSIVVSIAQSQINTCLTNLQSLQQAQLKSFQKMSADEQLAAVLAISVTRSTFDPRLFTVKIKVITKGTQSVSTSFAVNTI